MIYLTNLPFKDEKYQIISDFSKKIPKITKNKFYFIFVDGKITLPFFKSLQRYESIVIFVKNIELFHILFNVQYEWLNLTENEDQYLNIEKKIRNNRNFDEEKAMEISFYPKIFDSIRTSLLNPKLYLSEENGATMLFKKIMKSKMRIEDIEDKESLNSLLFSKILTLKDGYVSVNELLK